MIADSVGYVRERRARGDLRRRALLRRLSGRSRATRSRPCARRAEAGARTLVLCDTNGGTPDRRADAHHRRRAREPGGGSRRGAGRLGHPHAQRRGAARSPTRWPRSRPASATSRATINGYGERCGNANMVSILANLALKTGTRLVPSGGGRLDGLTDAVALRRRDREHRAGRLPAVRRPIGLRAQGRRARRGGGQGRAALPARRAGGRRQRRAPGRVRARRPGQHRDPGPPARP